MNTNELLKQASIAVMGDQLLAIRGDRSQEKMAEACGISWRQYSNLERRCASATSLTLLGLYSAGIDLNKWAEDTLGRYEKMCEKAEV